jgi:hypothetical protein
MHIAIRTWQGFNEPDPLVALGVRNIAPYLPRP